MPSCPLAACLAFPLILGVCFQSFPITIEVCFCRLRIPVCVTRSSLVSNAICTFVVFELCELPLLRWVLGRFVDPTQFDGIHSHVICKLIDRTFQGATSPLN